MLWESSSPVFIQMNLSIFLPKRVQHKLQTDSQIHVWISTQWKNNHNLCVLFVLVFIYPLEKHIILHVIGINKVDCVTQTKPALFMQIKE